MSLFSFSDGDADSSWIASINTTPLVDVLMVLLIIFLITIPIFGISVNVNLPAQAARGQGNADYVVISVDKSGELYLNNTVAPDIQALSSLMQSIASGNPQPELHIRADAQAPFAHVQQVIDTAQGHGFSRVSLITEPAQK